MSGIVIRDAAPSDAERLTEIYAWYVHNTAVTFDYEVPSAEAFRARMASTMARYPYLVAERGGELVGYAYAGPFVGRAAYDWSCELTIYLDPVARRQGVGRRLYEALEAALGSMGVRNLYACIGWPEAEDEYLNRDSAAFHARLGFREVGHFQRCGCKFGRWYDMIWMEKVIGDHPAGCPPVKWYAK